MYQVNFILIKIYNHFCYDQSDFHDCLVDNISELSQYHHTYKFSQTCLGRNYHLIIFHNISLLYKLTFMGES